ncbi:MAG: hypothetical protein ACRELA_00160 [Candidatus Rokuibacteriota bacterium]
MGVVSFRIPDGDEKRLRTLGISPGARAKELIQDELRRRDVEENLAWLDRHRIKLDRPVVDIIREIRDEH